MHCSKGCGGIGGEGWTGHNKWKTKIIARACREKLELYGYTDDETFKFGTRNLKVDRELKVTSIVD